MLIVPAIGWKKGEGGYPVFTMTAGQSGGAVGYDFSGGWGSVSTRDLLADGNLVSSIYTSASTLYVLWYPPAADIAALNTKLTGLQLYINGSPYSMTKTYSAGSYLELARSGYGAFTNLAVYTMQLAP